MVSNKKIAYSNLKIVHDIERINSMRRGEIFAPKTIRIDLNTICNHDCSFCLYQSPDDGLKGIGLNQEMPSSLSINHTRLIELISEFAQCGVESLVFLGGGEPLLHPKLEAIVSATISNKLEFGIITNGSRLDRLQRYQHEPYFKWVRVSLDAASRDTWALIHKPKSGLDFSQILNLLSSLSKTGRYDFIAGMSFIINSTNYKEVFDFIKLGKSLGVDNVRIGLEYGHGFDKRHVTYLSEVIDQIKTGKRMFESPEFSVFDKVSNRLADISSPDKDYEQCRFQDLSTNLGADLNLYTCCFGKYTPSHKIGSLLTTSFGELWFKLRILFRENFDIRKCPPCWYDTNNRLLEYLSQKSPLHAKFID